MNELKEKIREIETRWAQTYSGTISLNRIGVFVQFINGQIKIHLGQDLKLSSDIINDEWVEANINKIPSYLQDLKSEIDFRISKNNESVKKLIPMLENL